MAKEFIIAIELGSSKVTGIAGKKNIDGSINVLAVVKEDSKSGIRKGVVYKTERATACLTNIISKLRTALNTNIAKVYVGVGGQSLHGVKNVIVREFDADTIVSQSVVDSMMDTNRAMSYSEQSILEAVSQEFKVDSQHQTDPVGIQCRRLEGNILNILWRKSNVNLLRTCLEKAGISVFDIYLTPLTLAESVLTPGEMRSGCLLVDLGADTTTVSVYYRNVLRHITVIPLGSDNINKDIETLPTDEETSERLKLKYGSAVIDSKEDDDARNLKLDEDRTVAYSKFCEIVQARAEEIVRNVWHQVPDEYCDKLLGGIVLTGGGSNLRGIDELFRHVTHCEKVRVANFVNFHVSCPSACPMPHDGTMTGVLSLLAKGEENCAGAEVDNSLFGDSTVSPAPRPATVAVAAEPETPAAPAKPSEVRKPADAVASKPAAPEPSNAAEKPAEEPEEEEETQHKSGPLHKLMGGVKSFVRAIITGDSDEKV